MSATILHGDCIEIMRGIEPDSVDLVFGSPPYCDARTYGIGAQRGCLEWVEWMLNVSEAASRVCRGPVLWVCAGVTRKRNYWPACEGLLWEWWKRGGEHHCYRPCYWHRVGIPGSGGDDWFRADVEYVLCLKRPGKLPWSDNTAMGKKCGYPVGGAMSNRTSDGQRRNARTGARLLRFAGMRRANGTTRKHGYTAPEVANPGTLLHTKAGGGHLGAKLAHENEAPFPENLAEHFILSLCPPGGTVLDCFAGSGTTLAVALRHGRKAIGIDVRKSQCDLTARRVAEVQKRFA